MKTILIVEENETNMYLTRYLLTKKRYKILEAVCGIESIEIAKETVPDLIVMDIQLPDISGLEATRRMRNDEDLKDVPIVAFTSYAMPGVREKALEAGCNDYIQKPIQLNPFLPKIEAFL